ncbi:MAG: DeoR/GlpR family DNA-binding transcription regulator [Eubacterium sp.]
MFIEERHQKILELLKKKQSITNQEIQEMFGISYDSAKRDLRLLEEQGLLKRTHGGAIPLRNIGFQADISNLTSKERVPKVYPNYLAIAKRAVACIEENDVVFITAASIGYLMTQNLPQNLTCTVVTNSISIADNLRQYPNVTTLLLGGELQKNGAVYDGFALEMLRRIRFDKIFITSACISAEFGLSIQRTRNLSIYNALLSSARKVYGLYPSGKVGMNSIISLCPVNALDVLITDEDASEEDLKSIEEKGVEIWLQK